MAELVRYYALQLVSREILEGARRNAKGAIPLALSGDKRIDPEVVVNHPRRRDVGAGGYGHLLHHVEERLVVSPPRPAGPDAAHQGLAGGDPKIRPRAGDEHDDDS